MLESSSINLFESNYMVIFVDKNYLNWPLLVLHIRQTEYYLHRYSYEASYLYLCDTMVKMVWVVI